MSIAEINNRLRSIATEDSLSPQERHDMLVQVRTTAAHLAMALVDEFDLIDQDDQIAITDEELDDFDDEFDDDWEEVAYDEWDEEDEWDEDDDFDFDSDDDAYGFDDEFDDEDE